MIMKKRTYIKPEAEELSCIYGNILAASTKSGKHETQMGEGGVTTEVGEDEPNPNPTPNPARSFGDDFGFDE